MIAVNKIVIILSDRISNILNKGEITKNYYNPGNLFNEVHFIILNDDKPNLKILQYMVGDAKIYIYNLIKPNFLFSLGYNEFLISNFVKKCLQIVQKIQPNLIRSYNNFLEGYLSYHIKKKLFIPYVISLHGVWDRDCLYTFLHKIRRFFLKKFEIISLKNADAVIAVYKPIIRYALEHEAKNVHLIYNIVNFNNQFNYNLSESKLKLITINRQQVDKNPENIIKAISEIDCEYYLVGDGPYHERLKNLVRKLNMENKVFFIKSMKNESLIKFMCKFDIFISNNNVFGVSKGIIEASLCGMPIITNDFPEGSSMDLDYKNYILCQNNTIDFKRSILLLKNNSNLRLKYAKLTKEYALKNFNPKLMEEKTINLYKKLISNS